jgi:hypothetical protein
VDPKTGQRYTLQSDEPEQWICDGKYIWQVNVGEKTTEEVPLPPELQGPNIMDGPMPFLFGMPVEQSRRRYEISLAKAKPNTPPTWIWLNVKPRLPKDAANWSSANVILDSKTYLPLFVKMIDPSGNLETVYHFKEVKVNEIELPWARDIFKPPGGHKIHRIDIAKNNGPTCPALIGLSARDAAAVLKKCEYEVGWQRGEPAKNPKLKHVVYEQSPDPKTPLAKGAKVILKVYDEMPTIQQNGKPAGPAPRAKE